jgi:hypothetical protein
MTNAVFEQASFTGFDLPTHTVLIVHTHTVKRAPQRSNYRVVLLHEDAPSKPAPGAPCNGCGLCCAWSRCPLGWIVSGGFHQSSQQEPCSALRWNESLLRYQCGMVSSPQSILSWLPSWITPIVTKWSLRWISSDSGCDADLEIEREPSVNSLSDARDKAK